MFSITIAGEGDDAVHRVASALRGKRFRVETLDERRAALRRGASDGLVIVSPSADRLRVTRVVVDARREDDVRFLPFALVARGLEPSAAAAFGAKAFVRFDGTAEELATEIRRMLLREQESAVLLHQLEGELGALGLGELLETFARARRDAVVRVANGASRGVVALRRGEVVSASFDALSGRAALQPLLALRRGRFRVELRTVDDTDELQGMDVPTARAILEGVDGSVGRVPPARSPGRAIDERGPTAALAAAVMNAIAAYARQWIADDALSHELEAARSEASASSPPLAAFSVSPAGMISVLRVELAGAVDGHALGAWVGAALERLERRRPGRFGRAAAHALIGGLSRLITQMGWGADFEAALAGGSR